MYNFGALEKKIIIRSLGKKVKACGHDDTKYDQKSIFGSILTP